MTWMKNHNKQLWMQVQQMAANLNSDPGPIDGIPGEKTAKALKVILAKAKPIDPDPVVVDGPPDDGKVDKRSAGNIASLNPKVRKMFEAIVLKGKEIAKRELDGDYKMISGHRSYEEQNELYKRGRWGNPGPRVTNARGGYSNHNFGIAGDMAVFDRRGNYIDGSQLANRVHRMVATWAKSEFPDVEWGGDWTSFVDYPHFQYKNGLSMQEMRDRVAAGKDVV
jgi:peptidoglycan L-alanyl-D-glutamate endopeptidase CwlK